MKHILDRPVWSALETRQRTFAEGGDLARRYRPSIIPFAATATDDPENLHALGRLLPPGENAILAQADSIVLPPALVATMTADAVQMIAEQALQAVADARIEQLTRQDAAEMLALASLTKPGPFTLEALSLGEFWGVKIDGRLAAMAGERMKQPGYSELSGVCSHPDFRGGGLARLLSLFVANRIVARGEVPYLHAFANNAAAIRLYESIGFRLRSAMNIAVVRRAG
ncbi:GNAT family N-acetyltransferase [Mesorhizobium sp. M2D.F.Ca.ET.185.01.1.1]|uniref:GNAT family N-acetyltransferase n=1 Tax=unclassified Mesorhizobium TaxID=325217 RepID=UPI000FCAB182|nr:MULTISPECIES: GNAT family N-acetyltransferase [unclassified Mesorhizobium]TGP45414.1 GNAT family N-acetyltransferase [bacterium M00.F.Ca.ET.230.01.1.1]TGP72565.1 GNAT family N-acetyltransferase [bacterium M00.F.Ca.ET.227.01.1.1]TGP83976.1 GNAT family N-acetyltransferase [bacterium M00.F.Ca.ET.221.01.1.1]TGP85876.1 GNAT family N-acetyltransferase [bacterium M00.F.Ca.ET.222.01.1.1]TGT69857.1 GNAT family N-acetyltransferase [bacterium M00.F.Ca.ET.159.01.1.1]TGT81277.1 GNAT family N-acetyltran